MRTLWYLDPMMSLYLKTSIFTCTHRYDKHQFSIIYSLESIFVFLWRVGKNGGKSLCFALGLKVGTFLPLHVYCFKDGMYFISGFLWLNCQPVQSNQMTESLFIPIFIDCFKTSNCVVFWLPVGSVIFFLFVCFSYRPIL